MKNLIYFYFPTIENSSTIIFRRKRIPPRLFLAKMMRSSTGDRSGCATPVVYHIGVMWGSSEVFWNGGTPVLDMSARYELKYCRNPRGFQKG